MVSINTVNMYLSRMNKPIEEICKIKKYLKTSDKFRFYEEYMKLCEEHKNDFGGNMINYISYILFCLLVVKYYTNIEMGIDYESFDCLMEYEAIYKIIEYIGSDYSLLIKFIRLV